MEVLPFILLILLFRMCYKKKKIYIYIYLYIYSIGNIPEALSKIREKNLLKWSTKQNRLYNPKNKLS